MCICIGLGLLTIFPSILIFLILPIFIIAGFYFNRYFDKPEEERITQSFENIKEEIEAGKWLEHEFLPKVTEWFSKNALSTTGFFVSCMILLIFLWEEYFFGLNYAINGVLFFACMTLYNIVSSWGYKHYEKKYPKIDNVWLRGYIILVPPLILGLVATSSFGLTENNFGVLYIIFYNTLRVSFAYLLVFLLVYAYMQMHKEHLDRLEQTIRNHLEDSD